MKKFLFAFALTVGFYSCSSSTDEQPKQERIPVEYPKTAKMDHTDNYFGTQVADPYRWLETIDSSEVAKWVEAQNKTTFGLLEKIPYRKQIRERLEKIWNYPKFGAPFHRGNHYFFYKNNGLQNQSVLYIMNGLTDEPKMFLDPNTFSTDGSASLSTFSVSHDGKYAAYGKSEGGSDWNDYFVLDIESGKPLDDHLKWIKFSDAAWEGNGFYYGRYDAPQSGKELSTSNEFKQIYYHKIGDAQEKDEMVFQDREHPRRGIYAVTTDDERFLLLFLSEGATNNNALYVKDLKNKKAPIKKIITGFDYSFDVVDNTGDELLIVTNEGAPRKRLISINVNNADKANWKEIIPQREEVLNGVSVCGGKLYADYLKDASSRIYVFDLEGKSLGEVKLPGLGTVAGITGRKEDKVAFYTFASFTYPSTIFKLNTETDQSEIFRKSEIDFNPDAYETKQVKFKSKDGTMIPMFITHKKGIELNGKNPTMLYGYGGFNINILPSFSTTNIILLENGGVYAVANLRGGGEYGEEWHTAGILEKKQNVFDDFISAAEYLIAEKYTSPEFLAIHGRSNGGLLVGAAMCQRPELFKVAIPGVGVLDMLRYHKFTIGHAWAVEYGSSDNEADFKYLYKYSPLHNLKEGTQYPATMVVTGDHDDRVVPAHSFKFIARLQEVQKGENPVLIRVETQAGHGAGKPTGKVIEEWADVWTFMFYNMGITPTAK
jgi:prolyl oligopeptidase